MGPASKMCNQLWTTSNYNSANLCLSVCMYVCRSCLSFDFQENPSHGELQTRPMCCPEPDDVQYDLSLYGCGQLIELNDLRKKSSVFSAFYFTGKHFVIFKKQNYFITFS